MFKRLPLPRYDDLEKAQMSAPPQIAVPVAKGMFRNTVDTTGYELSREEIEALEKQIIGAEANLDKAIAEGFSVVAQYVAHDKSIMLVLHRPD